MTLGETLQLYMEEENSQILENAQTEFNKRNFKEAEELYTRFISSCLQSRYCLSSCRGEELNQPLLS